MLLKLTFFFLLYDVAGIKFNITYIGITLFLFS